MMNTAELGWLREAKALSKEYTAAKQPPWQHNFINLFSLSFLLCLFCLACLISSLTEINPFIRFFITVYLYGITVFGLIILVIHESSHRMFLLLKSREMQRRVEDVVGSLISGCFFINYLSHWKQGHVFHHQKPLDNRDPQNCIHSIVEGKKLFIKIMKLILVPGYALSLQTNCPESPSKHSQTLTYTIGLFFWSTFILINMYNSNYLNIFSLYYGLIFASVLNQCKICLEHGSGLYQNKHAVFRSRSSFMPLRHFLLPFNISIHWEHHLNAAIPWYKLPSFHQALKAIVPKENHKQIWNMGSQDVIKQLKGEKIHPEPS